MQKDSLATNAILWSMFLLFCSKWIYNSKSAKDRKKLGYNLVPFSHFYTWKNWSSKRSNKFKMFRGRINTRAKLWIQIFSTHTFSIPHHCSWLITSQLHEVCPVNHILVSLQGLPDTLNTKFICGRLTIPWKYSKL